MRLLLLVPDALPAFRVDVAVLFGKYLPREGIVSDVIGRSLPGVGAQEQGFASAQRSSPQGGRLAREWAYLRLAFAALTEVQRPACDAIVVRDMVSIGLLAVLTAGRRGIPCAYWMSYLMSEGRRQRALAGGAWRSSLRATLVWLKGATEEWLLHRVVLPRCRHVFAQSEAMRAHLVGRGLPAQRVSAVPMGVDTEVVRRERVAAHRPPGWDGVPLVAYLGSLERSREPWVLVDMLRRLRERYPAARLLLVGSADSDAATDALRARIAAAGLADVVQITGWLPSAQAFELICGADVTVSWVPRSPVYDLSSPTKLLETLALGLPSVANDNPDQAEVLARSRAGRLAASDAVSLADAVAALLADPVAATAQAAAGPAAIDGFRSYRVLAAEVAARLRALCG